ncbi:MAG TPA: hypothetical protein VOA80_16470 [Thermoanaerobaculia bacterium]|nr:hypothetical protein [Thermoanaerobaculia bacterium]
MRSRDLDFRPVWILACLLAAGAPTAGRCWAAPAPGEDREAVLLMEADCPVYSFVLLFRARHGIDVVYEEPAAVAEDGADKEGLPLQRAGCYEISGCVVVEAGGSKPAAEPALSILLGVRYRVAGATGQPQDPASAIRAALAAWEAAGGTVRFELIENGAAYHLVPRAVRSAGGGWIKVSALLDTPVELARKSRTVFDTVSMILGKLEQATGQKIEWGNAAINWVEQTSVELGGRPESARELLDGAVAAGRWTWELLYDKRRKAYDFHMAPLGAPKPAPAAEECPHPPP